MENDNILIIAKVDIDIVNKHRVKIITGKLQNYLILANTWIPLITSVSNVTNVYLCKRVYYVCITCVLRVYLHKTHHLVQLPEYATWISVSTFCEESDISTHQSGR